MRFFGTYGGVVENVRDPEKLGRAKVRVAHIHGVSNASAGYIGVNDLPWAMPAGMPAGGSAQSGGFSHLPAPGDHVWVRFLDGEPEKPIWEWGMQTFADRDKLKLHPYAVTATGEVGKPQSSFWTRFNHAIELAESGINAVTSQGYRIQIIDGEADGRIDISTSKGNFVRLDDLDDGISVFANQDLAVNVGDGVTGFSNSFDWTTMTGDFSVICGGTAEFQTTYDFNVGATGSISLDALSEASLTAPLVRLGSTAAIEPAVLGTQLTIFLESLLIYLATHTHGNGNNGSPTTPPIVPPTGTVQPDPSLLISKTVFTV